MGPENKFINALTELLIGTEIDLYDGTKEVVTDIYTPELPEYVSSNTNFVMVPLGPQFDTSILGQGGAMRARKKVVAIMLFIFHDGVDKEAVVRNLSELTYAISSKILDNNINRIGGSENVNIVDADYDWASVADADKNTLTVSSSASMLIVAEYGRG